MREAVIVEALRTPIARGKMGKGELSGFHPAALLAKVQQGVVDRRRASRPRSRAGRRRLRDPGRASRPATSPATRGCRAATAGTPAVRPSTPSAARASRPTTSSPRSCEAGSIDCRHRLRRRGDEPRRPRRQRDQRPRLLPSPPDWPWDSTPDQFTSAERIAKNRGITREDVDAFGPFASQQKAAAGARRGSLQARDPADRRAVLGDDGQPTGETRLVEQDQGIRESDRRGLANLKPVIRRRHPHGRQLVADLRRRGRRCCG